MTNRTLGLIGMLCAPALLLAGLLTLDTENPVIIGSGSMLFMGGALASLIGLWRVAATGTHWWGRGVLGLQIILVALAFLFGFFEATALVSDTNPLFIITNTVWPLSMITMNLVGITTAVAGRLRGWRRFALLPCGLAFPVVTGFAIVAGAGMESAAIGMAFFGWLAVAWALVGFIVYDSARPSTRTAPSATTMP
jgi:hypothetical protein